MRESEWKKEKGEGNEKKNELREGLKKEEKKKGELSNVREN